MGPAWYEVSATTPRPNRSVCATIRFRRSGGRHAQVIVCKDVQFRGDCILLDHDVSFLNDRRVGNDAVTSLKVQALGTNQCPPGANQASFYTNADFLGRCVTRDVGDYPTSESIGLPNDSISSIRVGSGAQVVACVGDQFSGRCEVITGSSANLAASSVGNDQITSLKVQPIGTLPPCFPGPQQVGIYVHDHFSGACRVLSVGDFPTAASIGLPNDSISSIRVGPGTEIHVCEHDFYGGTCSLLTSDTPSIGNTAVGNDSITSVRVRLQGQPLCSTGDAQVTFFGDWKFSGPCSTLSIGEFPTAISTGLANDSISSFRLGPNVEVVVVSMTISAVRARFLRRTSPI
ncbi:MAG: hypothetical protein IPM58_02105 [Nitrospira sp.]|nr:hypothetical protein [Nitrospira sp.]